MNRHSNNTNALLVEIMAAVLFFALCSTVILQVFAAAHRRSQESEIMIAAMAGARDVTEQLNASDEPASLLAAIGFLQDEATAWHMDCGGYGLSVTLQETPGTGGTLLTSTVTASSGTDQELFTLHGARYRQEVSR